MFVVVFFFKQKTAYERRISDWSSDVCSSDLQFISRKSAGIKAGSGSHTGLRNGRTPRRRTRWQPNNDNNLPEAARERRGSGRACDCIMGAVFKIGRASCRESVCKYV